MKVLIVYAQPEPRSLNGSLKAFAVPRLQTAGHEVQVSDLYAMNWKAPLDANDIRERDSEAPFHASLDSKHAYENGLQSRDIEIELVLSGDEFWYSEARDGSEGGCAEVTAGNRWR